MAAKKTGGDFAANQRQLNEEIARGDLRRVYLLCGEQAYLRLQNKEKLTKALLGDGDAMNLSRYSGASVTALEVIEMAQTLPFFADRRVIVLENTGLFNPKAAARSVTGSKSSASISEEADKLAGFVPDIPDTASIVFVEENVDKRGKLYKAILKSRKDELGEILECTTPDEADLRAWTSGIFRRSGLSVNGRTLALFLSYTGEDMQNIAAEAEKLCCYCMGRKEITEQDIRDVCSPRIKDRIFDMIEAIAMRDRKKALEIYMELCALRTAPQVILTLMRRQFEQLIKINENDVVIGISFPRYSKHTVDAMTFSKSRGAYTVAITDGKHSPCYDVADVCLFSKSDMVSFLDSLVAPMSLINALIVAVGSRSPDNSLETFKQLEHIWEEYDVYETYPR